MGYGTKALFSGGPVSSGPSTQANTTYWNVRSFEPILPPDNNAGQPPGDCAYGVDLVMVGMEIIPAEVSMWALLGNAVGQWSSCRVPPCLPIHCMPITRLLLLLVS